MNDQTTAPQRAKQARPSGGHPPDPPVYRPPRNPFHTPPAVACGGEPDDAAKTCGSGGLPAPTTERAADYPERPATMDAADERRPQDGPPYRGPNRERPNRLKRSPGVLFL